MRWLFGPKKPDKKTISRWIGSVCDNADRQAFHEMRRDMQVRLFGLIGDHVLRPTDERSGRAAYLLVHLIAGRGDISSVAGTLRLGDPAAYELAEQAWAQLRPTKLHPDLWEAAVWARSLEITNEAIEGNYQDALAIAQGGVKLWPEVAELWRQQGVLKIALGEFGEAMWNLKRAQALKPVMLWLEEPIEAVTRLLEAGGMSRREVDALGKIAQKHGPEGIAPALGEAGPANQDEDGDYARRLVDWFVADFHRDQDVDLSSDRQAILRLTAAVERAITELSSLGEARIDLPFIAADQHGGPKHLNYKLTRGQPFGISADLIERQPQCSGNGQLTKVHNPNCEGAHCTSETSQTRILPLSARFPGAGAIILCESCFSHEIAWRREANQELPEASRFALPAFGDLELYPGIH